MKIEYGERNVLVPKDEIDTYTNLDISADISLSDERQGPRVAFCCTIDLPPGFEPALDKDKARFLYTTDCLYTSIEEQQICCESECGPVYGTCFIAKIMGCIPYVVSIPVIAPCGGAVLPTLPCTTDDKSKLGFICCKGNVCIEQEIGKSTTRPNLPKLTCDNVTLTEFNTKKVSDIMPLCTVSAECGSIRAAGIIQLPTAVVSNVHCPPGFN
ncbi:MULTISPECIES: hypothetical protein [Bacillus cereus group]|uniref:hypothetical protein n=1 Tax=Bacillus cereus group TaxID=86661 RepID=UPI00077AF06B|nr:hypothetical protein [Bacillus cereus]KXY96298.1 hypothetical protein AT279_08450 [Bacillus cereus]MCU5351524.1 hypothetical protein [Bacillus cereus]MDK7410782.1 hypothetical protein [Bacillus cereus]MDK7416316.1 hypothetical protein [Bacillus cereus]MEC0008791.1 hypothetical protein [Bacillus cereus]